MIIQFGHSVCLVGVEFSALMKDFIDNFDEKIQLILFLNMHQFKYAFLVFENYGGVGIDAANHMAEIWDEYLPIYEKLHELVDWYKKEADACDAEGKVGYV